MTEARGGGGAEPLGDSGTEPLRFGVNVGRSAADAVRAARWAEDAGFDVVTVADHLGAPSPTVVLGAVAAATVRVRLRTYVLDHGLWNVALFARDVATLDVISAGRAEIGLGAGNRADEYADAGVPFLPFAERVAALEAFATELRRRLDDREYVPRPVQRPVPLFVAAMSAAALDVAARLGELVGLSGLHRVPGGRADRPTLSSPATTDERVAGVRAARAAAGLPPARFDALLQQVVVDRDPEEVAAEWEAEDGPPYRAADILDSPFVLLATSPQEAAAELLRRSRRWGITSWCTHGHSGAALARVIAELRR